LRIANWEPTIERIEKNGNLQLRMDSGRRVKFDLKENPHLDYGYAVTSHASQGQTTDRVLVHVNTEQAGDKPINRRLAYLAVSRGRYAAQIHTNDKASIAEGLRRDVSHRSALESKRAKEPLVAQRKEPCSFLSKERERTIEINETSAPVARHANSSCGP
jgi:ATP-dependent exoDNAse (exonuclease V) alpha subunit